MKNSKPKKTRKVESKLTKKTTHTYKGKQYKILTASIYEAKFLNFG